MPDFFHSWLQRATVTAAQFEQQPEPDFRDVQPHVLPH
jgi:hypothetical protein